MDARINVFALFGLSEGDAHVLRNAGVIVTDDVIRSLVLSQRLLGTTEILLVQHTRCGMLSFTDTELAAQIESETGQRPPFSFGAFQSLEDSIGPSILSIQASPFIAHKQVSGYIYNVDTARSVRWAEADAEPAVPVRRRHQPAGPATAVASPVAAV